MNTALRRFALALSLLILSPACRETPDEPRAAPAVAPAPPVPTATAPSAAPAAREQPLRIRPDLLPRLNILQPLGLRTNEAPAAPAAPEAAGPAPRSDSVTPGAPATDDSPTRTTPPRESPVRRVEVHPIDAVEGEDGRGHVVPAVRPVAIDLHADAWGGRGLDPVLVVGELEFRHYDHPSPGLLRFVAADADALPAGRPVWLRYGDRERFRVAEALEVPR